MWEFIYKLQKKNPFLVILKAKTKPAIEGGFIIYY